MQQTKERMSFQPVSVVVPALAPAIGPFNRAIQVGSTLYISGTSAISHIVGPGHSRVAQGGIREQTEATLRNIQAVMEAASGTLADIVKIAVMLRNPEDYEEMNAVRAEFFTAEPKPASSCFICPLIRPEMLVEMEAIAVLKGNQ